MDVVFDLFTSLSIVIGIPKEYEKPIGSTMACVPVKMAAQANITLTTWNVGRRKSIFKKVRFTKVSPTSDDVNNSARREDRIYLLDGLLRVVRSHEVG